MTERRIRQRGQATVEHVGVVVLVLTLVLAMTAVAVRSLHPSASPPDLVGRIADRLAAPLGEATPAPASPAGRPDAADAPWVLPEGEPYVPFWIRMDLHHHEAPIGRWLRRAKDALADHLPEMGEGCVRNMLPFEKVTVPAAPMRTEMGVPALAKKVLRRANGPLGRCLIGATGALLP